MAAINFSRVKSLPALFQAFYQHHSVDKPFQADKAGRSAGVECFERLALKRHRREIDPVIGRDHLSNNGALIPYCKHHKFLGATEKKDQK